LRPSADVYFHAPRDFHSALDLRGKVWGDDHPYTSGAYFNWLYGRKPAAEPQGVLFRRDDGDAIAFVGLVERRATFEGKSTKVGLGFDFMVHPDLPPLSSGRLAVRMAREWLNLARTLGIDFEYHFPNSSSFELFTSKHVGERLFFIADLLVRPLRGADPSERMHPKVPRWATAAALRAAGAAVSAYARLRIGEGGDIVPVDDFDEEFDSLYEEAAPQLGFATVRDREHLRWRYSGHPTNHYETLALRKQGRLAGYIITVDRALLGARTTLIVDLLVADWRGSATLELVEAACRAAEARNNDLVAALAAPGSQFETGLRRAGLLPVPRRFLPRSFPTIGRPFTPETEGLSDPRRWYFTWGDTDVV